MTSLLIVEEPSAALHRAAAAPSHADGVMTAHPVRRDHAVMKRPVIDLDSFYPPRARYEIRVAGALSQTFLLAFPQFTAEVRNQETRLVGTLPDQAALHGALVQVQSLGLQLIEVRRCPT
jgi:hypothetical protein